MNQLSLPSASRNTDLDAAILALYALENITDLRWLSEEVHAWVMDGRYTAKLHGHLGGHEGYVRSDELDDAFELMVKLKPADLRTLETVINLLRHRMAPQAADDARGTVQLKTLKRRYKEIDWVATGQADGKLVYVLDENGGPVMQDFYYTYAYVRLYASGGDADRKRRTLLSLYADRGMGKGGSGGYVAAALDAGLITEKDILDAWHADDQQGQGSYQKFIDQCTDLIHSSGIGNATRQGNLPEGNEGEEPE